MRYIFISLFVLILLAPGAVFAQETQGLVTCDGTTVDGGIACDFCKFILMVHRVAEFLVAILVVLATILLAVTGVQMAMSAGNSDAKQLLKERLTNIVIGFILIVASWTLIDTLLKALVSDATLREQWSTPIEELCATPRTPIESRGPNAIEGGESGVSSAADIAGNADEIRDQLADMNVQVNKGECPVGVNFRDVSGGCTNVGGFTETTMGAIDALSDEYALTITGGTEIGHTNTCHVNGTCFDTVALGVDSAPEINAFIATAKSNGARNVVYEVTTEIEHNALVAAGVPDENVAYISWATGNHFSVYVE